MSEFKDIEIYDYSTKSFVVRGETKQYRDSMVALGGKWNSRLTDKDTGDRFGGWIFPAAKRIDVETWKSKGVHLEAPESKRYSPSSKSEPTSSYSRSGSDNRELVQKMAKMEQRMAKMEKMMEKMLSLLDDNEEVVIESDSEGDDTDDREARKPRPRLLVKK